MRWKQPASAPATSEPHTDASGSSSSGGEWPTPTATEYGSSNNGSPHDNRDAYATAGKPSLSTAAKLWPTATHGNPETKAHAGTSLTDAAVRNWPTPRAEDSESAGSHHGQIDSLTAATRQWPTPMVSDIDRGSGTYKRGNPTLSGEVKAWATPMAHDAKGRGFNDTNMHNQATSGRPAPTTCTHGGTCLPTLNPVFVAWLMGAGLSWATDALSWLPWGMQLFGSAPKSSDEE